MIADRQTHTDRQTDTIITILRSLIRCGVKRKGPGPVVTATALSSLQCFDTDGWVARPLSGNKIFRNEGVGQRRDRKNSH